MERVEGAVRLFLKYFCPLRVSCSPPCMLRIHHGAVAPITALFCPAPCPCRLREGERGEQRNPVTTAHDQKPGDLFLAQLCP